MDITSWALRKRNYVIEASKTLNKTQSTPTHPLQANPNAKVVINDLTDPLNMMKNERRKIVVEEFSQMPRDSPADY